MERGGNIKFDPADRRRAIIARALESERAKGRALNVDPVEFHASAEVHDFDADGKPVVLGSTVITWKEG